MESLQKIWGWLKSLFAKSKVSTVPAPSVASVKPPAKESKPETADDFSALPLEKKLEYARNGVWINKGIQDFFAQRFDPELTDEDRREIARAYAFRTGMPYNDPTIANKAPTGHGMGDDGRQR